MSRFFAKAGAGVKEFFRKTAVHLKRRPHNIALAALMIAFVVYSCNLTTISNTTALVNGKNMGLACFVTMLFSILSLVCFLNAFPKRKKPVVFMVILLAVMIALVVSADVIYYLGVENALTRAENPLTITQKNAYVINAQNILIVHVIIELAAALLTALIPVYGRLFRMIKTSKDVEDNGEMEAVEFSE